MHANLKVIKKKQISNELQKMIPQLPESSPIINRVRQWSFIFLLWTMTLKKNTSMPGVLRKTLNMADTLKTMQIIW